MYFVVVPEGYGDEEPDVQNQANLDQTQYTDDTITLTGQVLSGSETGEVYVEVAFFQDNPSACCHQVPTGPAGFWAKSDKSSDGDTCRRWTCAASTR